MSLARIYSGATGLGQLIITKLRDVGGPPAGRVSEEFDNLIAWAKASPRCIHRDTSTVGNVGAGLDNLHSFSLPANSLQADGDYLVMEYSGKFAANDNNKRVSASFGGTVYTEMALSDLDSSNQGWNLRGRIIRLSSTSVRITYTLMAALVAVDSANAVNTSTNGFYAIASNKDITGLSNLNSNATTMLVQGEADGTSNNNDVTQNFSIIELTQQ